MGDCFGHDLGQGRPPDRRHRGDQLVLHQVHGLAEQEYPDLMAGFRERVGMEKGKGRFGRVVRPTFICGLSDPSLRGAEPS
jgi:hypothetical protein